MMTTTILGILAGTFCTVSFVPQVLKIYKTKNVSDLSIITFSMFSLGVALWMAYGIVLNDYAIIIANGITLLLSLVILCMKFKYQDS
jgi:MtN3 and saliva related transmembrane protein